MQQEPWLIANARRHPDRVALECGGERLTYAQLHARAAGLDAQPGERVAIALPPGIDFAVALHAAVLAGAVAVPIDLRHTPAERAERARTVTRVIDAPLPPGAAPARDAGHAWADGEPLLVVHTSGTTAHPKEVVLTHGNVRANARGVAAALGLTAQDRWLCPMPLTHVGGLMILLRSLILGSTAIVAPPPFDAAAVARRLARGDATVASMVPTMLARVLDRGLASPPGLRCVMLGGGPVDPALVERAAAAGVPVSQTYGLSEACSTVTVSEPGDAATAGRPLPGVGVRIDGDGEILVEGPVVAGGGVLRTGDLGLLDDHGRLRVIGRRADTIVTGGENVAPAEVEAVLLAHPAIAEAGVYARPDAEWGEAVCAKVVLHGGATGGRPDPDELREWCAGRLARFKVPKAIEVVPGLPRTESGKLLRRRLRYGP